MITQPPPIIAPLVEGDMRTVITSPVWRLFFQKLQVAVVAVVNSYVTSFNGRLGDVTPQAGDYSVSQITGAVAEAPIDGNIYVRRNGVWEILIIS